jgi:hypothetical protein
LAGLRIARKKEETSTRSQDLPAGWNFIPEIDKTRPNPLNFDLEDLEPDRQEPVILWNMRGKGSLFKQHADPLSLSVSSV